MKVSETFPSKYLKASDLQGREVKVIMQHVEMEKLGDDMKPVLYFKGKEKGVCLNKTNSNTIADAYGDDTDDWADQELILFSVMVDFQGKVGPAIRCRVPTAKDRKQPAPAKKPDPISSGKQEDDMDDSIPF
jgi:arabinogalactan endo-1,4-beta-galactosidase